MTKSEANEILDGVKHGIPTPQTKITQALIVTGDLGNDEGMRSKGMAGEVQAESLQTWRELRTELVGQSSLRHSAYSR